jgi:hypothetical protein
MAADPPAPRRCAPVRSRSRRGARHGLVQSIDGVAGLGPEPGELLDQAPQDAFELLLQLPQALRVHQIPQATGDEGLGALGDRGVTDLAEHQDGLRVEDVLQSSELLVLLHVDLRFLVALPAAVRGHPLQHVDPGHGLDRVAVGFGGRDLPLGQVEGLGELRVAESDQVFRGALRDRLDAAHQRLLSRAADAGPMTPQRVEEARDLVAVAVRGTEVELDGAARLAQADDLVQLARPRGEGTAEQAEAEGLADVALARLVAPDHRDQSPGWDLIEVEADVFQDVLGGDPLDDHTPGPPASRGPRPGPRRIARGRRRHRNCAAAPAPARRRRQSRRRANRVGGGRGDGLGVVGAATAALWIGECGGIVGHGELLCGGHESGRPC